MKNVKQNKTFAATMETVMASRAIFTNQMAFGELS